MKGNASDVVRILGTGVTVRQALDKLESTFGNIETKEGKFFSCKQKSNEPISTNNSRLEKIFSQAVALKGISQTDDEQLKRVLYEGLRPEIKHHASYKNYMIADYDRFKIELRKIDAELKDIEKEVEKCNTAFNMEKKESNELSEVKDLLKKLHERMTLKRNKRKLIRHQLKSIINQHPGTGSFNKFRGRGGRYDIGKARGRVSYKP